ncbi:unnamed protein product [Discula destructiva]
MHNSQNEIIQVEKEIRGNTSSDISISAAEAGLSSPPHNGRSNSTPELVDFATPFDPADPLQWPPRRKLAIVVNISLLSAAGQMASSMVAPSVEEIMLEFHAANPMLGVLVVSVFMLGMAVGLLLTSGVSEVYGRVVVVHVTNLLFVVFACAAAVSQSLGQLIGFRFVQAVAAAAAPAIGGGVIGDMFDPKDRGRATGIYGLGMLLGPSLGPVAGGYITQEVGWRWNCWVIAIVGAVAVVASALVLKESYRPLVLERKVKLLRQQTGNPNLVSSMHHPTSGFQALKLSFVRPLRLLLTSPLVALPALGLAVIFGMMFLMLSTMSTVYQQVHHWSIGASGLPYLGLGVGLFIGLAIYSVTADKVYRAMTKTTTTTTPPTPEMRLAPLTLGSPLCATGLVIYGWALDKQVHWLVPIVGCVVFSFGLLAFLMPVTTYLIDAFPAKAAGPVGAASVLRCLAGGLLPLCADKLYVNLGYGWGNTTLAFIALALAPFPYLFYKNGERLRRRFPIVD